MKKHLLSFLGRLSASNCLTRHPICAIFFMISNSDERSVLHAFLFPQKAHPAAAGRLHTGTNPNRIQHLHRRNHHWFLRCCRKEITVCRTGKNTSRHCRFLCTIWAHTACPLVRKRLPLFIPCDSLFLFRCFCMFGSRHFPNNEIGISPPDRRE